MYYLNRLVSIHDLTMCRLKWYTVQTYRVYNKDKKN